MAAVQNIVSVRNVAHHYKGVAAIDNLSISFPSGKLAGLIGPDGAGKSTLLGLIAGARRLQTGEISVLGGSVSNSAHLGDMRKRVAYMPQGLGRNLYMELTVRENLEFFGRLFGLPREERAGRVAALLKATGLDPFPDRLAGKLSGGMKQKLGLCAALIHEPELLILDEPTTGVDPLARKQFWDLINEIRSRRKNLDVIVATAYMPEAEQFDWLMAMEAGQVLSCGAPEALMEKTGVQNLEEAFVALRPTPNPERRAQNSQYSSIMADESDISISARGLTRRFGDFTAVDAVDFEIRKGEIFGFVGSNGCGKTTTMKMLTGLLEPSDGEARLFGEPVDARDINMRRRIGYMSQSFSLYGELTVRQNLDLHARLYDLAPENQIERVENLIEWLGLAKYDVKIARDLPLGVRQRLSLAVAVIHEPEVLILDEPTSGVDPAARDRFWDFLVELSRDKGVTIFISTHYVNEAERCDRVALMHAGRVLATDTPAALAKSEDVETLEDAFVSVLTRADGGRSDEVRQNAEGLGQGAASVAARRNLSRRFSLSRIFAYTLREALELRRDPIRLTFAMLGTAILMIIFGYGITLDVEDIPFAVLDYDQTPGSREYLRSFSGSRYFLEKEPLADMAALDRSLKSSDISVAIIVPDGFGKDVKSGRSAEVSVWIDGAMPFRATTIRGYVEALHQYYLLDLITGGTASMNAALPVRIEPRFRYNQSFESINAMVPAVVALLLLFIPAMLTAVGVVREKELGSITNFYVTPVTRFEFLLGKQLPYVTLGVINFFFLVIMSVFLFGVPVKGSFITLLLGSLLYVGAATAFGLFVSTFTKTQVAALFGSALLTMIPAMMFSGLIHPVTSLEGSARVIGQGFPMTYFLKVSHGVFMKDLGFMELRAHLAALAVFVPALVGLSAMLLSKQSR
ncbi:MAG: multidrug ABC transporter ATP-binding protein [Parvularcula sp.]|nr:multidrug ABC transporter ATP-binding protein [Parvularcula sp.]